MDAPEAPVVDPSEVVMAELQEEEKTAFKASPESAFQASAIDKDDK